MESYDLSHLPPAVHDAVLQLLEVLVQAFPVAPMEAVRGNGPSADSQTRFPRSATELLLLQALEAIAPAPASPQQLAAMLQKPRLEVQAVLTALATLGAVAHPAKGLYRDKRVEDECRPSTRFAAQIAALCASNTSRGPTASPALGRAVQAPDPKE
jgi:hypothetical protein